MARRKQGQNDVPQLPNPDREGRILRREKSAALECQQCNKRFSEPEPKPFGADVRLPVEKVTMILRCLAEGNSVRSTSRLCDVEKRTVLTMLKMAGDCCERFMERILREVPVRELQLDECWTYCLKKEAHLLPHEMNDDSIGSQYVYIGLERTRSLSG
jgi:transposase-like protein